MKQTRYSKQRELIYEALCATWEHPSAEMLYQSLKASLPSLSLGTVYRNLNLLVEEGRAVLIPAVVNRYDGATHEHPHFICTACDAICDLELAVDQNLNPAAEDLGHCVHRHELIFKGICRSCVSAQAEQKRSRQAIVQHN